MAKKPLLSVIIPVFNESQNVTKLHQELIFILKKLKKSFEIIFIDDGSLDDTFKELGKLKPVKIIQFRRNFGQSAAFDAGIKEAKGEILITMDGDGQNNPQDIPKLLKKLNGYDCVCGWRFKRNDSFSKKFVSRGANFLANFLINPGVHDSGCTLRVYRAACFKGINLYGEMHRGIPALLRWHGFKITEEKVDHRPRKFGKTKYNWKRIIKGLLDMVNLWFLRKYRSRPLHLFGGVGLALSTLSVLFGLYLTVKRLFFNYSLADKIWPLVAMTGFITGVQLLVFGLLANLIIQNKEDDYFYRIKKIVEK